MSYQFKGIVRYSEIGENGLLTLPGILNYFQDCSTFHSESVGLGMEALKERQRFWVLGAWQVLVDRYPGMGEEIVTSTWAYGFRGFIGLRNFTMETPDGERLAYANSTWIYLDRKSGKPTRLTEADTVGYGTEPKLEMDYADRKIILPKEMKTDEAFLVQKHHLDTNHHVNNCQYVRMAMDFLPADVRIRQMRVEYKQQARLNDAIYPFKGTECDKTIIALNKEDGTSYAVVEFQTL